MKLWLFDILACPMDKHFPLSLYIFSYEPGYDKFEEILKVFDSRDLQFIKKGEWIKIEESEEGIKLSDEILLEKKPSQEYFKSILSSIDELIHVHDRSNVRTAEISYSIIKDQVKSKIKKVKDRDPVKSNEIDELLPELYLINKIKMDIEIETGLLFCEKCRRWYPIIDTIPQMLPDEYRNAEKDLEFLKNHKILLDKEFFNQDLKPFNL
jgi:uncharacterized protein YbaR (Trm112 family)